MSFPSFGKTVMYASSNLLKGSVDVERELKVLRNRAVSVSINILKDVTVNPSGPGLLPVFK